MFLSIMLAVRRILDSYTSLVIYYVPVAFLLNVSRDLIFRHMLQLICYLYI